MNLKKIFLIFAVSAAFFYLSSRFISIRFPAEEAGPPKELQALAAAYNDRIIKIKEKDGEWALKLDDEWFYWLGGRMLPESKITDKQKYGPFGFYEYHAGFPLKTILPEKEHIEYIKTRGEVPVSASFLDKLYGGDSYREIKKNIREKSFFNFNIRAHKKIVPALKEIEKEIKKIKTENNEIKRFIKSLNRIECFSWRRIQGSTRRSYHSYGAAVDLIPVYSPRKIIYWLWTKNYNSRWYEVPYEERWMVPREIVEIFEKYGFIWGGKWLFYDNMHFEYRPELLIMGGSEVKKPQMPTVIN